MRFRMYGTSRTLIQRGYPLCKMNFTNWMGKFRKPPPQETFMYSTSTTKVFFDVAIDNQPAGRLVFKVYDDLEKWTAPFSTTFIKLAEMGKNRPQALSSFIGSEFQRCGQGRGSAVAFSTTGKSDVDLFEMRKLFEFMMHEVPFTNAIKQGRKKIISTIIDNDNKQPMSINCSAVLYF